VLEFSDPYFVSASCSSSPPAAASAGSRTSPGRRLPSSRGRSRRRTSRWWPRAKRVAFKNMGEAVQALKTKKADALCQDDMLVLALAKENRDLSAAGKPILPRPYAIAVRKGDLATLRWVNEKLSAMRKDGATTPPGEIFRCHGRKGREAMTVKLLLEFAVVIAAILMGSRYGGSAWGCGRAGVLVLSYGFGLPPTAPPST